MSKATTGGVYIGTSGWSYLHWRNDFYRGIRQEQWLEFYAGQFRAVEINASFYRRQSARTLQHWHDTTPDAFRFVIKGHRYITHNKKLRDPLDAIRRERDHARPLDDKLLAVLWQLPASLPKHIDRLKEFFHALQHWPAVQHVIEFRHPSWFCDEVSECMQHNGISNCISDAADWPAWFVITSEVIYIRLHGHTRTYASRYSQHALERWTAQIRQWLDQHLTVHVYFDNDAEGAAPHDALRLLTLLDTTIRNRDSCQQ